MPAADVKTGCAFVRHRVLAFLARFSFAMYPYDPGFPTILPKNRRVSNRAIALQSVTMFPFEHVRIAELERQRAEAKAREAKPPRAREQRIGSLLSRKAHLHEFS